MPFTKLPPTCAMLLTLALLACAASAALAACPTDAWSAYNGNCYYPSPSKGNWQEARATCQAVGADLASLADHLEHTFASDLMTQAPAWIGLNDIDDEGSFVWSDGSDSTYRYWNAGEPNNDGNQDCVAINYNTDSGKWDDQHCEDELRFICKKADM